MSSNNFPFEIKNLKPESNKKVSKQFSDGLPHLVQVGPQKMLIPAEYVSEASFYHEFPFRPSDVLVMGHPRSGTTMIQEMLWLVFNHFNFRLAAEKTLIHRVPLLESKSLITEGRKLEAVRTNTTELLAIYMSSAQILEKMTKRRVMKTHLHFNFLPENLLSCGCKVIYVARNPKDVVVSMYHVQRNSLGRNFKENFESYFDLFLSNLTLFSPFWSHLDKAWQRRSSPNLLFIFYEDFLQNRRESIGKILDFVGEKVTRFQLDLLYFVLEFDNFKKYMGQGVDKPMNDKEDKNDHFIRKGKVGGSKKYFTEEMEVRIDKWAQENLARTGIEFPKASLLV